MGLWVSHKMGASENTLLRVGGGGFSVYKKLEYCVLLLGEGAGERKLEGQHLPDRLKHPFCRKWVLNPEPEPERL